MGGPHSNSILRRTGFIVQKHLAQLTGSEDVNKFLYGYKDEEQHKEPYLNCPEPGPRELAHHVVLRGR